MDVTVCSPCWFRERNSKPLSREKAMVVATVMYLMCGTTIEEARSALCAEHRAEVEQIIALLQSRHQVS